MSLGQSCALLRWPFADMCAMANVFAGMSNFLDGPTAYSFSPFIDVAVLNGGDYNSSIDIRSHIEINVNGYWPNNESASSNNFEPGVYTVVAGDEWGTLVVVHFTVS